MISRERFINHVRYCTPHYNAKAVLCNLIDRNISIFPLSPRDLDGASIETLESFLHHGWNINRQVDVGNTWDRMPYMWHMSEREEMMNWCLDHGASMIPHKSSVASPSPPILECVAAHGDILTYNLLHAKGAPSGRSLQFAVAATARQHYDRHPQEDTTKYKQQMDMVR